MVSSPQVKSPQCFGILYRIISWLCGWFRRTEAVDVKASVAGPGIIEPKENPCPPKRKSAVIFYDED